MKTTPLAIIAVTIALAVGGYAVYNRQAQTATKTPPETANGLTQALDADVQAVIDELCTKWDSVEKLTAVIRTKSPNAAGFKGKTKGEGNYAYQKTDSEPLIRFHLRNLLTIEKETTLADGTKSPRMFTGEVLLTLYDGHVVWNQISQYENEKLYKRKYDPAEVLQLGGRALWNTLTDGTTVKVLADEKVDEAGGTDAYVFSVTPLDGDWTSTHWFDKKTGLRLKTVEKDLEGKESLLLWLEEIDFAPSFADDRFVYQIPEGWEVIDETAPPETSKTDSP